MSNSPSRKRALVTGATGYIGSNLVRHLLVQGWDVHIITRPDSNLNALGTVERAITVHCHNGTSFDMIALLANAQPDIVFHLASLFLAQHKSDDIEALISSNLLFSTQLADAMVANGIKYLINTGTSWQNYNNEDYNPVNLYAATKQAFESILTYYVEGHGLKVTTLILFDTYGPNDPRSKLLALLWQTATAQLPISMSPGEQLIDLVHVDDVVRAFTLAADALTHQKVGHTRYGVSSGTPIRLIDLVAVFESAIGKSLPITWGGRSYRPREVMVPWSGYNLVPNWKPKTDLRIGILNSRP